MAATDAAEVVELEPRRFAPVDDDARLLYEISRNTLERVSKESRQRIAEFTAVLDAMAGAQTPLAQPAPSEAGTSAVMPALPIAAPEIEHEPPAPELSIDDVPATFMRRYSVEVPHMFEEGEQLVAKPERVSARVAIDDVVREIDLFERLAGRPLEAADREPAYLDFDLTLPIAVARDYEARGMSREDAETRAVAEHLDDLRAQLSDIEATAIGAYLDQQKRTEKTA